jgi:hypothetical protein
LDVGSNIGLLTAMAARTGLFAIGVEGNWNALSAARRKYEPTLSVAYMHFFVTPETVTVLPICDVVLCLSVYHRWHHDFGHE